METAETLRVSAQCFVEASDPHETRIYFEGIAEGLGYELPPLPPIPDGTNMFGVTDEDIRNYYGRDYAREHPYEMTIYFLAMAEALGFKLALAPPVPMLAAA